MDFKFYEWFYNIILTSANSVPIQSLWVAFFTNPINLNRAFQAGTLENGFGYFSLAPGAATNTAQGAMGALFANAVKIPGEGINANKIGPDGSGMIKGTISSGRRDFENLSISFLDTNQSFTDYNIRPWIIYANHKSLKDKSVKTAITVIQLAKTGHKKLLSPRAIWTFHDACPISISTEDFNYGADNVVSRTIEFSYNWYTLNANPLSVISTVKSVFDKSETDVETQPVDVEKGGLTSHKSSSIVTPNINDSAALDTHNDGQIVKISEEDNVKRAINVGLDLLTGGGKFGGSNVKIKSDDAINRLFNEGQELLKTVKVNENDSVSRNNLEQTGYEEKLPVGPGGIKDPDNIIRPIDDNRKYEGISITGNTKSSIKDNADTPLFFPGDLEEESKKIKGKGVDTLDTPEGIKVPYNQKLPRNDTVNPYDVPFNKVDVNKESIKIEVQSIDIKRNEPVVVNIEKVNAVKNEKISVISQEKNISKDEINVRPQIVTIKNIVTETQPKLIHVNSDDTVKDFSFDPVTLKKNISAPVNNQTVTIERNKRFENKNEVVSVKTNGIVGNANIPLQIVNISKKDTSELKE